MTKQDAEALADRLARTWGDTGKKNWMKADSGHQWPFREEALWHFDAKTLSFHIRVQPMPDIFVLADKFPSYEHLQFRLVWKEAQSKTFDSLMRCEFQEGAVYLADQERLTSLVKQWLLFFRRGCWLCGCPIGATDHEKAEWMHGFTREEVEAWNLKI